MLIATVSVIFLLLLITGMVVFVVNLNRKARHFEQISGIKGQLLQQISQQVRTPLNSIVGMGQLASESKNLSELKEYLANIKTGTSELLILLNNLIHFLQIESKSSPVISAQFNLLESLEELFGYFESQCKNRGLLFHQRIFPDVPEKIISDQQKLFCILQNLLGVAVRGSSKGVVKAEVKELSSRQQKGKNYSTIRFTVIDEGYGFSREEIEKLLKGTHIIPGMEELSIGLKNVKDLSGLLGGHLESISGKGVGTSFVFELEVEVVGEMAIPGFEKPRMGSLHEPGRYHILIAEDNPINQQVLARILEKEGYHFSIAENGKKALQLLTERKFNLVLLDIEMPELNGVEVLLLLRNKPEFKNHNSIPVIMVTAYDDPNEMEKCQEAGASDFISKPVNKRLLLQKVESHLSNVLIPVPNPTK